MQRGQWPISGQAAWRSARQRPVCVPRWGAASGSKACSVRRQTAGLGTLLASPLAENATPPPHPPHGVRRERRTAPRPPQCPPQRLCSPQRAGGSPARWSQAARGQGKVRPARVADRAAAADLGSAALLPRLRLLNAGAWRRVGPSDAARLPDFGGKGHPDSENGARGAAPLRGVRGGGQRAENGGRAKPQPLMKSGLGAQDITVLQPRAFPGDAAKRAKLSRRVPRGTTRRRPLSRGRRPRPCRRLCGGRGCSGRRPKRPPCWYRPARRSLGL